MGPSRGMPHPTATKGRMTPLFLGGVAHVPALHAALGTREGRFKAANHSGMRDIEESGFAALLVAAMPYPPSDPAANIYGLSGIKKHPIFRVSQPVSSRSANRTARHGFGNSSGLVEMKLLA